MATISSSDRSNTYAPVNSAGPFPIDFPLFSGDGSDLDIRLNGAPVLDFALTATVESGFYGAPNTWVNGSIMLPAPVTGELVILGRRAPRRIGQYAEGRGVPARDHNTEYNILTAVDQELRRDVDSWDGRFDTIDAAVEAAQVAAGIAVPASEAAEEYRDQAADYAAFARNDFVVKAFAGDGVTVAFDLQVDPGSANNCFVTVDAIPQRRDSYALAGTVLTFSQAPPGDGIERNIEVVFGNRVAVGTPADGAVTKSKLGAAAVDETKIDPAAVAAIRSLLGLTAAYVSAHKNSVDQTGITSAVKVTYGTEERDEAGWWDAANSRLQPTVACTMRIVAAVYFTSANMSAGDELGVSIRKNGSSYRYAWRRAAAVASSTQVVAHADVQFNGTTDYVEIFAQAPGSGKTAAGASSDSYFQAHTI